MWIDITCCSRNVKWKTIRLWDWNADVESFYLLSNYQRRAIWDRKPLWLIYSHLLFSTLRSLNALFILHLCRRALQMILYIHVSVSLSTLWTNCCFLPSHYASHSVIPHIRSTSFCTNTVSALWYRVFRNEPCQRVAWTRRPHHPYPNLCYDRCCLIYVLLFMFHPIHITV